MLVYFQYNNCCGNKSGTVAFDFWGTLAEVSQEMLVVCDNNMGDDCRARVWANKDEAISELTGELMSDGLAVAFAVNNGPVLESTNGGDIEYLALPEAGTDEYHQAIIDDLTSCSWGDCDIYVDHRYL